MALNNRLAVYRGNITKIGVDVIVNAANPTLLGGGGVDGAIHAAAGPALREECAQLGGCPVGQARITAGYNLPAPFVIHTVGPIWQDGRHGEARALASCYTSTLQLMEQYQLPTAAFPAISTGVYGYPKEQAAAIAVKTVSEFLAAHSSIHRIYFVVFDSATEQIYHQLLDKLDA